MAGVYIRGMEMPEEGFVEVLIRADGTVQQTGQSRRIDGSDYYTPYIGETPTIYSAIPVPPHGRLIDANKLNKKPKKCFRVQDGAFPKSDWFIRASDLFNAPTIIPAEEVQDA